MDTTFSGRESMSTEQSIHINNRVSAFKTQINDKNNLCIDVLCSMCIVYRIIFVQSINQHLPIRKLSVRGRNVEYRIIYERVYCIAAGAGRHTIDVTSRPSTVPCCGHLYSL